MLKPESEAERLLSTFHEGSEPSFPIDPVRIARSLGINVYESVLDNNLSGMIARLAPETGVDIVVNSEHAPKRQRFTVAHELGHYVAIMADKAKSGEPFIHKRDARSACGTYSEEVFANQFAAELLMPRSEMARLVDLGADEYELAARMNVSLDAIAFRLKNLRIGVA